MKRLIFVLILVTGTNLNSENISIKETDKDSTLQPVSEFVPLWAKEVVWYQIFPERFRNGDTQNDPTLESIDGAYPHNIESPWQVHPWTSDFYELQPYEKENGKDIWYNLQRRRYGGDIQGMIDELDYLQNLGIGAIYINPVFWSPSLHKYDAATYHHIDPYFGPDPEGDKKLISKETSGDPSTWVWTSADKLFLQLVKDVHSRNMKIIIDGVFNHMGLNSWAFKDVIKNQKTSKFADWFKIEAWEDENTGEKFKYHGWFGVKELPELNQDENGITEGPKNYIFNITKRWMDPDNNGDPSDGIDGWRLDVAFMVKHKFWKDWRVIVKQINPDAYLTAEVIDSIQAVKPYLLGDEFDAVMNYNFLFTTAEYFIDDTAAISTTEFDNKLKELRKAFPSSISYVQQNLFDSHDTQRVLSHILNRDKFKMRNWSKAFGLTMGSNPDYNTSKPGKKELEILKLMIIFQMTYVGAPYIYYGDEAGMWGANDPSCRKPMVWDNLKYEPEAYFPNQQIKNKPDSVSFNKDLFEYYKKLIEIRNSNPALQLGDCKTLLADNENRIYAFERKLDHQQVIVVLNNGKNLQTVILPVDHNEYYIDLMNGEIIPVEESKIIIEFDGKQGRILKPEYYK